MLGRLRVWEGRFASAEGSHEGAFQNPAFLLEGRPKFDFTLD